MTPRTVSATISGGMRYPDIRGEVAFTQVAGGLAVMVNIDGLPPFSRENGAYVGPHGFHLHTGNSCQIGTSDNPFPESGSHYNPGNQPHGNHAGDFPVLFSNSGKSMTTFFTDRLGIDEVIGKAVIVHMQPDDFRTEPAGDSGEKIACGVVM